MLYLFLFGLFAISYLGTKFAIPIITNNNIVDSSNSAPARKLQARPVPLLGGLVFTLVGILGTIVANFVWQFDLLGLGQVLGQNINSSFNLNWIILSIIIIVIGGFLDDKYRLTTLQLSIPVGLALFVAVFFGNLKISSLSYPFDTLLPNWEILHFGLAYIWIGLCLSATKFLDGHDGLVGSVGILSLASIGIVSIFENVNQPFVFVLSCIWVVVILGFLPFNLPNARLYLGEIGSEVIGFMIGVLSIISGAKVATVSSIIGWFLLDLLLVFWIRYRVGKSIFEGGREHWHFRLYDSGMSKWGVLLVTLLIIVVTQLLGLILPTAYKPFVILLQVLILFLIFFLTNSGRGE